MVKSLNLNEDCCVNGVIKRSCVSSPEHLTDRPKPVYSVTIGIDPGLAFSIGLLYEGMGPETYELDKIMENLMNARELTFDSIQKPLVSGINIDTKEFDTGTPVRVSCRFEYVSGEIAADGYSVFKFPRLTLRFVALLFHCALQTLFGLLR